VHVEDLVVQGGVLLAHDLLYLRELVLQDTLLVQVLLVGVD